MKAILAFAIIIFSNACIAAEPSNEELQKRIADLEAQIQQMKQGSPPPVETAPTKSYNNGYIRGPRGGCYTITASGRKRYVDRSLCN